MLHAPGRVRCHKVGSQLCLLSSNYHSHPLTMDISTLSPTVIALNTIEYGYSYHELYFAMCLSIYSICHKLNSYRNYLHQLRKQTGTIWGTTHPRFCARTLRLSARGKLDCASNVGRHWLCLLSLDPWNWENHFFLTPTWGIEPKGLSLNMFKSVGLGLDMDPVQGSVRWLLEHCRNLKQSQRSLGKFDAK